MRQRPALQDHPIPWEEEAVLVHELSAGERRIVCEGSLYAVVYRIHTMRSSRHAVYRISMPDRMIAPFGYGHEEFERLLGARVRARMR